MQTPEATETIRTRGLLRGRDTISIVDYENNRGIREMIAASTEWKYSDNLYAWVRDA
jgi:predicted secreted protein